MVVRTYSPVGKTPILKENLTRDHLWAMSGITLAGKFYILEQEKAFSRERTRYASSSTSCAKFLGQARGSSGRALRYIADGR
jgi:hypothetical protein